MSLLLSYHKYGGQRCLDSCSISPRYSNFSGFRSRPRFAFVGWVLDENEGFVAGSKFWRKSEVIEGSASGGKRQIRKFSGDNVGRDETSRESLWRRGEVQSVSGGTFWKRN